MRNRNARISGRGNRRRDAGHDLKRHARRPTLLRLFPASSKYERIAAFQARHRFALPRLRNEQRVDVGLFHRMLRARLADVGLLGVRADILEQGRMGETIVDDDVARAQQLHAAHGDQSGIARSGSNQIDRAGRSGNEFCHKSGICQSIGGLSAATRASLIFEKGLLPKKPLRAESGEGCADWITVCRVVSIKGNFFWA